MKIDRLLWDLKNKQFKECNHLKEKLMEMVLQIHNLHFVLNNV